MSADRDIPEKLHTWLTQEMRFTPPHGTRTPAPDDLRGICRGPMVGIWKFVLRHVHSIQHDRKQSRTPDNDEDQKLVKHRAQLTKEISMLQADIQHIKKELQRLAIEMVENEKNYQSLCESVKNTERRTALLSVYSKQNTETVQLYREFKKSVDGRVDKLLQKPRLERGFVTGDDNDADAGLETAECRLVRETCANIGSFFHETLQGTVAGDKAAFNERKHGLWSQVERTLSDLTMFHILSSLVTNTNQSASVLRDKTLAINIKQEAEKLRFKFEKIGQLKDISSSTPLQQSVHQLLEESQLSHIHDFMMAEKHLNQAFKQQQEFDALSDKVGTLLSQTFSDRVGEMQLAQKLVALEQEVIKSRAALHTLLDTKDRLQESIQKSQKDREKKLLAYKKIQNFQQIADSKQNLIRVLSKQNLNARSRLDTQRTEVLKYIQKSLSSHLAETKVIAAQLEGRVTVEVEMFTSLVLPFLLHVYLDGATKVGQVNLSIKQASHPSAINIRPALYRTLNLLGFDYYKAMECALPWCMKLMREIQQWAVITKSLDMADKRSQGIVGKSGSDLLQDIEELRSKVTGQDQRQLERLLPVLNKRLTSTGAVLGDCLQVHSVLQDWWEQPAKNCVPWMKVNKQSFKEWEDRYKVLVTRLIKLQVQK